MSTNAGVVSDALKYVTQKTEQLTTMQKLEEQIEETETETETEETTSGIY
jgi:ribosomal protein S7